MTEVLKISELTELTAPAAGDFVPVVDTPGGETKKVDFSRFASPHNYGGLLVTDGSTAQTGITGTPVKLSAFAANMASNNTTPDHTADTITIGADGAGTYEMICQLSFSGSLNEQVTAEIYVDDVASGVKFDRKLGTGGDVGSASMCGLIALTAAQVVDVRVNSDGSTINMTVTQGQLVIKAI